MERRTFLQVGLGTVLATPLLAAARQEQWDAAEAALAGAVAKGQVEGAALCIRQGESEFVRWYGSSTSRNDRFLLGSISKPMAVAALMTLYDQGKFRLDDPAQKFLPEFTGGGREKITMRRLLTHVSGLPDQLPENQALRSRHAPLSAFVEGALRTPLLFEPGSQYGYSSMAILLAAEAAQHHPGVTFRVAAPIGLDAMMVQNIEARLRDCLER